MTKEIPLTRGAVALVDDEDYEKLSCFRWHCSKNGYALRNTPQPGMRGYVRYMHRLILNTSAAEMVDHINGNKLDNRRANLRSVTPAENVRNKPKDRRQRITKYKGVKFDKRRGHWTAQIMADRKHIYLGRFDTEIQAARAYDEAARHHFGAFACTNFPNELIVEGLDRTATELDGGCVNWNS